jgi:hypothetical protein
MPPPSTAQEKDYSGTPLPRKLGIREGSRVTVIGAPRGFSLDPMPAGTAVSPRLRTDLDVAVLFVTRRTDLERRFASLVRGLAPDGRLWVAWPKKASGFATDLTFEIVQRRGLDAGLVDNKSASITDVFQGLQFVVRVGDRPRRRTGQP